MNDDDDDDDDGDVVVVQYVALTIVNYLGLCRHRNISELKVSPRFSSSHEHGTDVSPSIN